MDILNKLKRKVLESRKIEEGFYSIVAKEMDGGFLHDGLWLQALQIAKGNKEIQTAEYIKLRVRSLKDDVEISAATKKPDVMIPVTKNIETKTVSFKLDIERCVTLVNKGDAVSSLEKIIDQATLDGAVNCINSLDACGDTLLHIAIKADRLDILEWLLIKGANCTVKNQWGNTPHALALSKRNDIAVELLERYS